jgi:two-component system cell cycle response regulator
LVVSEHISKSIKGRAVLIAEDDHDYRGLLARAAHRLGLEVAEASSGADAEALIEQGGFDALVLDILLPGRSGLDLLKYAKERDPDIQGIILTAYATVENAVEALRLDAYDYLVKPLDTIGLYELALMRAVERKILLEENQRLFEESQRLAVTDSLTGLFNRRKLEEVLTVELERVRRYRRKLSTIMIDVDNLKGLNDSHGHQAGDEVLRQLAQVISDTVRKMDVAVRHGGDEFIVLLPETGIQRAINLAERIAQRSTSIRCGDSPVYFSIGISEWGPGVASPEEFLKQVDLALYEAKQAGGRRIAAGDEMILAWANTGMD